MNKQMKIMSTGFVLAIVLNSLTACSATNQVGKSARSMTTFSSQNNDDVAVNEKLVIPPGLESGAGAGSNKNRASSSNRRPSANNASRKAAYTSNKNYYIVVGTYPDQEQALDTFVRLSSIGLPGAAMESRRTKSGKNLHMVRLGPYHNQEDIDKVKDSLTSDGLSQFKVVEN